MAYITTPGFAGVDLTVVDTSKKHRLGTEVQDNEGNTWMYCQADEAISPYQVCIVRPNYLLLRANAGRIISVPYQLVVPQVTLGDTYYAWCICKGRDFEILAGASCAADVKLYTSASIGVLDDDATSQNLIQGTRFNNASAGASAITNASSSGYMEANVQN